VLAFIRPDEFYRAYLLGFMCWLGVALGSMAILMIRHLTGGGWGTVIRRILGAAMRTLPLLAVLFIPVILGIRRLYIWAQPLANVEDKHLREHLEQITQTYLTVNGFIVRAIFYFAVWNVLSFLLSKWSKQTDHAGAPDNSGRFKAVAGPGLILLRIHHFLRRHRLDHVARSQLDLHHLRADHSHRRSALRNVLRGGGRAHPLRIQTDVGDAETRFRSRPRQVDAGFHHGLGLLQFFAMAHYLGGELAFGNHLLLKANQRRLGWIAITLVLFDFVIPFAMLLSRPFKRNIRKLVWVAVLLIFIALRRSVLDHRTEFFPDFSR